MKNSQTERTEIVKDAKQGSKKKADFSEAEKVSGSQSDHARHDEAEVSDQDSNLTSKEELKAKVSNWWHLEKEKIAHGDMLKFLQDNKEKLETTLSGIHQNNFFTG